MAINDPWTPRWAAGIDLLSSLCIAVGVFAMTQEILFGFMLNVPVHLPLVIQARIMATLWLVGLVISVAGRLVVHSARGGGGVHVSRSVVATLCGGTTGLIVGNSSVSGSIFLNGYDIAVPLWLALICLHVVVGGIVGFFVERIGHADRAAAAAGVGGLIGLLSGVAQGLMSGPGRGVSATLSLGLLGVLIGPAVYYVVKDVLIHRVGHSLSVMMSGGGVAIIAAVWIAALNGPEAVPSVFWIWRLPMWGAILGSLGVFLLLRRNPAHSTSRFSARSRGDLLHVNYR